MGREVTGHTISQCNLILDYLTKHESISQAEAAELFGCYRLPARVADLKAKGVRISKKMVTQKNRYGHTTNYARYSLEAEE